MPVLYPGDWVRVMRAGRLVVAVVEYIVPRAAWDSTAEAQTLEHGRVSFAEVLEVRRDRNPNQEAQ